MKWTVGFFKSFGRRWLNLKRFHLQFGMFLTCVYLLLLILAATPPAGGGREVQKIKGECILACLVLRFHCLFLYTPVREGEASHWCLLHRFFFEEPSRLKANMKINDFLIGFLQSDFSKTGLPCKGGRWWDKFWYTSGEGEASHWCMPPNFFLRNKENWK